MRKRVLAGILAVIMAGSIMTGCAGTKKTENKSSVSGENKNKPTSEKVELTNLGRKRRQGLYQNGFRKFYK